MAANAACISGTMARSIYVQEQAVRRYDMRINMLAIKHKIKYEHILFLRADVDGNAAPSNRHARNLTWTVRAPSDRTLLVLSVR